MIVRTAKTKYGYDVELREVGSKDETYHMIEVVYNDSAVLVNAIGVDQDINNAMDNMIKEVGALLLLEDYEAGRE